MAKVLMRILAGAVVLGLWASYPRNPMLSKFDPDALALADTDTWRAYCDKRYAALFYEFYAVARDQYGYSPLDSLRLALSAAIAGILTRGRERGRIA